MKVILLQDVAKIGRRSELVEVPDGYALNKLIPRSMAQPATPANMKRIEKMQAEVATSKATDEASFEASKKILAETKVQIAVEVNEKGHSFKAVSETDIAEAAKEKGAEVEASMIKIDSPIKEVGDHEVQLLQGGNSAKFTIEVIKK